MRKILLLGLLSLFLSPLFARNDPFSHPVRTVIIDPGHGGRDGGASRAWAFAGGTIYEKDLNLDIARRVRDLLCVAHPDWSLIMTRDEDLFVSLNDRCATAYSTPLPTHGGILFLSIHVNSAENADASGFEILVKQEGRKVTFLDSLVPRQNISRYAPFTEAELNDLLNRRDRQVAETFERVLSRCQSGARSRGVRERDVQVLWKTRVPSVLVEVGFISNEEDARNLIRPSWRQNLASAIVEAIEQSQS